MIRVLNFFCVALMGLSILALYNVSERTRLAGVDLHKANQQVAQERTRISVLETEWEGVASPAKIAELAQTKLGLDNTATLQLSSLELLPRRGGDSAPLSASPVRRASVQVPLQSGVIQQIAARSGTQ
jgi:hypothetical protein